ncbi:MAG TPA: T9SS type A sorting domain-containing protein [Candidatus Kapabacteria bacterium]|jgi:hypothetical protein|nr:T9SS type A sorting domain-containing protein [Candidatus Kapabacteria bacterium]
MARLVLKIFLLPEQKQYDKRARRCITLSLFCLALFTGIITETGFAQIPGHWEQVYSLPHWQAVNIQFSDAMHGIIFIYYPMDYPPDASVLQTDDGGMTWIITPTSGAYFYNNSPHSFSMPDPADAYTTIRLPPDYSYIFATHDSGFDWETESFIVDSIDQASLPLGTGLSPYYFKMFGEGRGVALGLGSVDNILLTMFNTWDSARHFFSLKTQDSVNITDITDAVILDTLNFWVCYNDGRMAQSTNGGISWKYDTIVQNLDSRYQLESITETPDFRTLYANLRSRKVDTSSHSSFHSDFVETTNAGASWRIDSSLNGARISRLSSSAPGKLWAFLNPNYHTSGYFPSDSVFYSPDDAKTWFKDSITFLKDTLTGMCWPNETHGYITATRDSTLFIYRFVADANVALMANPVRRVRILESPVFEELAFEPKASGISKISVIDLLGRERLQQSMTLATGTHSSLPVRNLIPGYYWLVVQTGTAVYSAGFVKE